jgi:SAM-dependent methyltransferase
MPACPVCGHDNPPSALFCARCTSPVAVVPLHQLDARDHRRCLAALFEILSQQSLHAVNSTSSIANPDLWQAYLSAFWLRPETALVLYGEALAIQSLNLDPTAPWLDLGCGDGIHAALYSQWRFDPSFDAFASLDLTAPDMYNRFNPAEFSVTLTHRGRPIQHGIDIKHTAVARAAALGVFDHVHQSNATSLPLPDRSVAVIFSNMLRDLGNPLPAALAECRRVLRDDGTLLLSTMTPAYAPNLYFLPAAQRAQQQGDEDTAQHLLKLDRGRSAFCQRQLTHEQWQQLLAQAGLRLHAVHPCVGDGVIRFWDIGLRPFIHALLAQRESWRTQRLFPAIKTSLLAGLQYLLAPLAASVASGAPTIQLLEIRKA